MARRILFVSLLIPAVLGLTAAPASAVTFTVNTTDEGNDGECALDCTLREAITLANTTLLADNIHFNIPGTGQHTISPTSPLPSITDQVTIDGTTDPDDDGRIELDGTNAGAGQLGLVVSGGGNGTTIRGLVINDFGEGIRLSVGGNTVQGNYIGTDETGLVAESNFIGMFVSGSENQIGGTGAGQGNVISGNDNDGVGLPGASNTVLEGNYIGLKADGSAALANGNQGVHIHGSSTNIHIGGTSAAARNVISGNGSAGVAISSATNTGNVIRGNYIGTKPNGTEALPNNTGVRITAGSSNTIGGSAAGAGNVISGNGSWGVSVARIADPGPSGVTVQGNMIGTTASGNAALGNGLDGIDIFDAPNTVIGGAVPGARNVVSGNTGQGIDIGGGLADNTVIKGNNIGLGSDGSTDLGNAQNGIRISNNTFGASTSNTTIGGSAAGEGNVISGNGVDGIDASGVGVENVTVEGNRIGTDATGSADRGNDNHGIQALVATGFVLGGTAAGSGNLISGNGDGTGADLGVSLEGFTGDPPGYVVQGNRIGTNAAGTAAIPNDDGGANVQGQSSLVGGTTGVSPSGSCTGACNLISGNGGNFALDVSTSATVHGNYIGTDVTGLLDLGNAGSGISGGTDNTVITIGGTTSAERNIISGNGGAGIGMFDSGAHNDVIQGNYIGVGTDGATALANEDEGVVYGGDDNTIGGTGAGEGNVIAHNGAEGVSVATTATGNAVLGNRVFNNGGLGIDLDRDGGVEVNDAGDSDTGANQLQNYPVLTSAEVAANVVTVNGTLNSTPSMGFRLEFFNNEACNAASPNDFGEGAVFLGFGDVTTDAGGNATFTFTSTGTPAVAIGDSITATATDSNDNTSEFSQCLTTAQAPPTLSIDDVSVTEGSAGTVLATFTMTRSGDTSGTSSAQYATANGTATAPSDYQSTSGTVTFAPTDTTETIVVTVNGDAVDEPTETFTVDLSSPSGATLSDAQGLGTILDDDAPKCPGFEGDPRPQLVGTDGADGLTGTSAAEIVCGLGGNDVLKGGGGKDLVLGGGGNDRLTGQGGKDVLKGQAGNDKMNGGPGVDRCQGGPGKDSAKACEKGRA